MFFTNSYCFYCTKIPLIAIVLREREFDYNDNISLNSSARKKEILRRAFSFSVKFSPAKTGYPSDVSRGYFLASVGWVTSIRKLDIFPEIIWPPPLTFYTIQCRYHERVNRSHYLIICARDTQSQFSAYGLKIPRWHDKFHAFDKWDFRCSKEEFFCCWAWIGFSGLEFDLKHLLRVWDEHGFHVELRGNWVSREKLGFTLGNHLTDRFELVFTRRKG